MLYYIKNICKLTSAWLIIDYIKFYNWIVKMYVEKDCYLAPKRTE